MKTDGHSRSNTAVDVPIITEPLNSRNERRIKSVKFKEFAKTY